MNSLEATDPKYAERDAAEYLVVSVKTLQRWRYVGRGPAFLKLEKLIRYQKSSLDRYLTSNTRNAGEQPA